jgi:hypothetical protein
MPVPSSYSHALLAVASDLDGVSEALSGIMKLDLDGLLNQLPGLVREARHRLAVQSGALTRLAERIGELPEEGGQP